MEEEGRVTLKEHSHKSLQYDLSLVRTGVFITHVIHLNMNFNYDGFHYEGVYFSVVV